MQSSKRLLEGPDLDDLFFESSQRNSGRLDVELKRLSAQPSENGSLRPSDKSGNFPEGEFWAFRRQKLSAFLCERLAKTLSEKRVAAFYLLWDNVQVALLSNLAAVFERRRRVQFELLKQCCAERRPPNRRPPPKRRFVLRSQKFAQRIARQAPAKPGAEAKGSALVFGGTFGGSFAMLGEAKPGKEDFLRESIAKGSENRNEANWRTRKNVFLESDEDFQKKLHKISISNSKGKLSSQATHRSAGRSAGTFSGKTAQNGAFEAWQIQTMPEKLSTQRKGIFRRSGNKMRRLREALEKEALDAPRLRSFERRPQREQRAFFKKKAGGAGLWQREETKTLGAQNGFSLRSEKLGRQSQSRPNLGGAAGGTGEAGAKLSGAVSRILFLLSKRFQDSKYKSFFLDQIEVLVFRHGVRDPQILDILNTLDLRFGVEQLCPSESEAEGGTPQPDPLAQQRRLQRRLEKQCTRRNIESLERTLSIFRADQFCAPLFRAFAQRELAHDRHFFVNLRRHAKLAPFRKLRRVLERKVRQRRKVAFSQILFYVKPNLRLLLLLFAISKVKTRKLVDSFRRIYGFYEGTQIECGPEKPLAPPEFRVGGRARVFSIGPGEGSKGRFEEERTPKQAEAAHSFEKGAFTNDFGDSGNEGGGGRGGEGGREAQSRARETQYRGRLPNPFRDAENVSTNFEGDDMTAKIQALQRSEQRRQTGGRQKGVRQDAYFAYYENSLNSSNKKTPQQSSKNLSILKKKFYEDKGKRR